MKAKMFLVVFLMFALAGVVSATGIIISNPDKNGGLYDYQYELNLQKGWNLIAYGENFPYYMSQDYIKEDLPIYQKVMDFVNTPGNRKKADSPLFAYLYNPETKSYLEIFPDNVGGIGIAKTNYAMWVYVKKITRVKYFAPNVPKLSDATLIKGWNFVAVNPEMVGRTFNQIKGDCDWTSVYTYSPEKGEGSNWIDLLNQPNFVDEEKITDRIVGRGLIIKISNDYCKLASSSPDAGLDSPPQLPDGNQGSQTIAINSVDDLNGGSVGSDFSGIVKTSESDGTYPEASEGFNMQVYMFSENPRETAFSGNPKYQGSGQWKIVGNYPNKAGNYEVQVALYCGSSSDDAVCRQVYGRIQKEYKYTIVVN